MTLQVISVNGSVHALKRDSGAFLWSTHLGFPMIGSHEYEEDSVDNNIFIPLVDGSLIRYDKEGFLEVGIPACVLTSSERSST